MSYPREVREVGQRDRHEGGEGGKRQLQAADQAQLLPILGQAAGAGPWATLWPCMG